MIRKTMVSLLFLFSMMIYFSCNDDIDCNCPKDVLDFFDVTGINLDPYKIEGNGVFSIVEENATLSNESFYGFALKYDVDYVVQRKVNTCPATFFNTAYACTCIEPGHRGSKTETYESLTVISLKDINEQYKANDTINDFVTFQYFFSQDNERDIEHSEFLADQEERIKEEFFSIRFHEKPDLNDTVQIKIIIQLNNGESYEQRSVPVVVE